MPNSTSRPTDPRESGSSWRRTLVGVAAAVALVGVACGSSYDRGQAVDDLVEDGGIPRDQAECIVDGVEDSFGIDRLNERGDLTGAEEAVLTELTISCLLDGDGG